MLPSSLGSAAYVLRLQFWSFVGLVRTRSRVAGGVEDTENTHRRIPLVLQGVLQERRQMHARTGLDRERPPLHVDTPVPGEHVDHLVVDVTVAGGPSGWDRPDELGYVGRAGVTMDEVAELSILACRKSRSFLVANDAGIRSREHPVWRPGRDEHRHELIRAGVVDHEMVARPEVGARLGLQLVALSACLHRPAPRHNVEDSLEPV